MSNSPKAQQVVFSFLGRTRSLSPETASKISTASKSLPPAHRALPHHTTQNNLTQIVLRTLSFDQPPWASMTICTNVVHHSWPKALDLSLRHIGSNLFLFFFEDQERSLLPRTNMRWMIKRERRLRSIAWARTFVSGSKSCEKSSSASSLHALSLFRYPSRSLNPALAIDLQDVTRKTVFSLSALLLVRRF